jgi:hypothetical protein
LLPDRPQRLTLHTAEPRGLVLYAEQERVPVFDGTSPQAP